jgi:undecaprenyl diphosphate synthase
MPSTTSESDARLPDVPAEKRPRHIAAIMDGNGRWARKQGLPRVEGHIKGAESVRRITEECARLGLDQLTLYCLSSENWKRPQEELQFLMQLLHSYVVDQRSTIMENNVRVQLIGRRDGLPEHTLQEIDKTVEMSRGNSGLCLCLAVNYGARAELTDAVRAIAGQVRTGALSPADITEQTIADHLYTAGMPDPDLLIRTAGEMRISNFLLWQISYTEIWVTERCWPEFAEDDLHAAIRAYAARERRFGGVLCDNK